MTLLEQQNPVYFVGAGPGDPDLITVKGRRLLDEAQIIVYAGSLVPKALIKGVNAELHDSAVLNLEKIAEIMVKGVQDGKRVVRLHTGDPAFYGAIREQMALLAEQEIPYEMVPGVSSANAAAAALATELTLPEVSQTVIITRRAGRTPVPKREDLRSLAAHQATMMIFLSVGMIEKVVKDLLAGGYGPETPVAVVERVSWPEERVLRGTLETIAGQVSEAEIRKTAIISVGKVFGQGPLGSVSKLYDKSFSHEYRK